MKRLLIIVVSILCIGTAGFAQAKTSTTQPKPVVKKEVAKTQVKQNTATTKKLSNGTASTTATTTTSSTTKVKKDGTPDKRFKENKTTSTVSTGPKKKNGTPDMRYKANKKKG